MVWAAEKCPQARGKVDEAKYMILRLVRLWIVYLNPVVFAAVL
jgi:hypothetical protein